MVGGGGGVCGVGWGWVLGGGCCVRCRGGCGVLSGVCGGGGGGVGGWGGGARRVTGLPVFCVSAKTGEGCDGLGVALAADLPEEELDAGAGDIDLSLSSASDAFTVTPDNSQWD